MNALAPLVPENVRQDLAGDVMNGSNEPLWQRVRDELGHDPTYAEACHVIACMPDAELGIYL